AKRGFHFRLATISLNDLRRAPLGAIRNQNAKSEKARDQPLILLPVAPETDTYRSLPVASNFIAQQLTKVLVATDLFQLPLCRLHVNWRMQLQCFQFTPTPR